MCDRMAGAAELVDRDASERELRRAVARGRAVVPTTAGANVHSGPG